MHPDPTTPTDPAIAFSKAAPCPRCGYDLRAHPDTTRCPECGTQVQVSAAFAEANWQVDRVLLDLWSISLLVLVGTVCLAVGFVAIRAGQYVALLLLLVAGLYLVTGGLWWAILALTFLAHRRRWHLKMTSSARRFKVLVWLFLNGALLIAAVYALLQARLP